jgi:transcriptional regulator GlxA family with amidase domain
MQRVGIFLFDHIELLDFAGPFEVFAVAARIVTPRPFEIVTFSATGDMITTRDGLGIKPGYRFSNVPKLDILIIPGGPGVRELFTDPTSLKWVQATAQQAEIVASVCTGALLLGRLGLLEDLRATTHYLSYDILAEISPRSTVVKDERIVDNGKLITSAGISAGIDMAFHIIGRVLGDQVARDVATRMEYRLDTKPPDNS